MADGKGTVSVEHGEGNTGGQADAGTDDAGRVSQHKSDAQAPSTDGHAEPATGAEGQEAPDGDSKENQEEKLAEQDGKRYPQQQTEVSVLSTLATAGLCSSTEEGAKDSQTEKLAEPMGAGRAPLLQGGAPAPSADEGAKDGHAEEMAELASECGALMEAIPGQDATVQSGEASEGQAGGSCAPSAPQDDATAPAVDAAAEHDPDEWAIRRVGDEEVRNEAGSRDAGAMVDIEGEEKGQDGGEADSKKQEGTANGQETVAADAASLGGMGGNMLGGMTQGFASMTPPTINFDSLTPPTIPGSAMLGGLWGSMSSAAGAASQAALSAANKAKDAASAGMSTAGNAAAGASNSAAGGSAGVALAGDGDNDVGAKEGGGEGGEAQGAGAAQDDGGGKKEEEVMGGVGSVGSELRDSFKSMPGSGFVGGMSSGIGSGIGGLWAGAAQAANAASQAALDVAEKAKRASLDGAGAVGDMMPGAEGEGLRNGRAEEHEGGEEHAGDDDERRCDRDYISGYTAWKPAKEEVAHVKGGSEGVGAGKGGQHDRGKAGGAVKPTAGSDKPSWSQVPGAGLVGGMGAGLGDVGDKIKGLPGAGLVGSVGGGLWSGISGVTSGVMSASAAAGKGAKDAALAAANEAKRTSELAVKLAAMDELRSKVAFYPDPRCSQVPLLQTSLRVATFNVMWQYGAHQERYHAIVEALKVADADVICLQEAYEEVSGSRRSLAALLASALSSGGRKLHHLFDAHSQIEREDGSVVRFGNAILSKWPIVKSVATPLPAPPSDKPPEPEGPRLVLSCVIEGPRGKLAVHCTQWSHGLHLSRLRQQQSLATARCVAALARSLHDEPAAGATSPAQLPPDAPAPPCESAAAASDAEDAGGCGGEVVEDGGLTADVGAAQGSAGSLAPARAVVAAHAPQQQQSAGRGDSYMLTLVCLSANAVPESDEVRALTGKAAFALSSDEPPVVLLDAWDAAGNLAPGWTWNNVNDWAAREMAPNRRLDAILVGEPCVGGRGQVLKAELFADDVVLKSCLGAMPSAMWPSDHFGVLATLRY